MEFDWIYVVSLIALAWSSFVTGWAVRDRSREKEKPLETTIRCLSLKEGDVVFISLKERMTSEAMKHLQESVERLCRDRKIRFVVLEEDMKITNTISFENDAKDDGAQDGD